jgi:hypothetical protein
MGEYLVGAYLKLLGDCEYVDYNVRFPGGGPKGLEELDVVGFDMDKGVAYLCEVVTHVRGLLYGKGKGYRDTLARIRKKHERQKDYADSQLQQFKECKFMLWSPRVSKGLEARLHAIKGLDLVINEDYTRRIDQLSEKARREAQDTGNPAFRVLQILGHMRRKESSRRAKSTA